MEGFTLLSPNNRPLSNTVGTVMQYSKSSHTPYPTHENDVSFGSSPSKKLLYQPFLESGECAMTETYPLKRRWHQQDNAAVYITPRTSRSQSKNIYNWSSMQRSDFTVKLETDKDQISQILQEEKLRRREMWRVSKFRSRKKRENYVNTLNNENRQLHDQIKRLEQRHHPVPRTNPAKENAWSVVVEYFQMFRFGLSKMLVKTPPSSPTKMKQSAQMDFLLASMKSDVLFNCDRGTDAIMKNWGFISSCFESVEMVLDGLAKTAFGSIVATTTTTVIFSEHTVDTLFPHLRRTDGNMREIMSTLGEKFVNEKIVMRGSTQFEWDSGYCRIASIQHQSDMITPVLHVLGTLENVSRVFDKALITPDFRCRQNQTRNI